MRAKLIAGNWKMNLTSAEATALVKAFIEQIVSLWDVDVVVCPPYLAIPQVRELVKDSQVKLGAQDCFWSDEGAFTGKVSAKMLSDFRCDYCIVGHSETRGRFGKLDTPESTLGFFSETDQSINLKIKALLYYSINPILCVGETAAERKAGETDAVIEKQLRGALDGVDPSEMFAFVVAYEPVWAIGTGDTCDPAEAERVCGVIRSMIAQIAAEEVAGHVRILYGGSVKPENSQELFKQTNIDGGLVGGASLDANGFVRIVLSA